jgi:hypothetical protein
MTSLHNLDYQQVLWQNSKLEERWNAFDGFATIDAYTYIESIFRYVTAKDKRMESYYIKCQFLTDNDNSEK